MSALCKFCQKEIRFVPIADHLALCPDRLRIWAGDDPGDISAEAATMTALIRRAAEPDAPQGERR